MQLLDIKYSFSRFLTLLLFCGFLFFSNFLYGQQEETPPPVQPPEQIVEDDDFHQRVESLIEESDEEIDATELIEELELLRQNPLNLNTASAEDLRRIIFLNDIQINNLVEHRIRFGNLINMMEIDL